MNLLSICLPTETKFTPLISINMPLIYYVTFSSRQEKRDNMYGGFEIFWQPIYFYHVYFLISNFVDVVS